MLNSSQYPAKGGCLTRGVCFKTCSVVPWQSWRWLVVLVTVSFIWLFARLLFKGGGCVFWYIMIQSWSKLCVCVAMLCVCDRVVCDSLVWEMWFVYQWGAWQCGVWQRCVICENVVRDAVVFFLCVCMFVLQFVWQCCAVLATQQVLHCFVQRQDVQRLPHNMPRRHGDACHAQPRKSSPSPATQMVPVTHEQQKAAGVTSDQAGPPQQAQSHKCHACRDNVVCVYGCVCVTILCVWQSCAWQQCFKCMLRMWWAKEANGCKTEKQCGEHTPQSNCPPLDFQRPRLCNLSSTSFRGERYRSFQEANGTWHHMAEANTALLIWYNLMAKQRTTCHCQDCQAIHSSDERALWNFETWQLRSAEVPSSGPESFLPQNWFAWLTASHSSGLLDLSPGSSGTALNVAFENLLRQYASPKDPKDPKSMSKSMSHTEPYRASTEPAQSVH